MYPLRRVAPERPRRWDPLQPRHRIVGVHNPRVMDSTVLTVFLYMSNDELYNASLVCTAWAALAMDAELWSWDGVNCSTTTYAYAVSASAATRVESSCTPRWCIVLAMAGLSYRSSG
jgi:hypothetical protein